MTTALLAPTLRLARTAFPEREDLLVPAHDQWALTLWAAARERLGAQTSREVRVLRGLLGGRLAELGRLSSAEVLARLRSAAPAAVQGRRRPLHEALLCVAELSRRSLGKTPYPAQLAAAAALVRGRLAEMQTGEGKTLTAALAACLVANADVPVHVLTVNDYLAERDAGLAEPLLQLAGLRCGVVVHGRSPAQKRAAYACEVVYGTGKEMVFDYLRDRVGVGGRTTAAQLRARALYGAGTSEPVMRGLHFAIVDEADSILIDEARTPLILAVKAGDYELAGALPRALAAAGNLAEDEHFRIDRARRDLRLTEAGRRRLTEDLAGQGDPWPVRGTREHLVSQALRALHLFERDRHYLVDAEGQVQIIDEYTGRVLDGRTWEQGLHQLIECKEGVALSERTRTLARITYQRYFTRYLRLAGMTGTSREVARELSVVYRLPTVVIPTHRPGQRHQRPARCCPGRDGVWQAVAEIAAAAHAQGQPVLAGTRTLADSEALSACLRARGVPHRVLNARQDAEEAALVAQAGQRGAITVATNMAGRGTDIELGEGVAALGGLLVLLTGYHESSRIDRQLFGRGARQGQPGAAQAVVARDDELFVQHGGLWGLLLQRMAAAPGWLQRRVLNRTRCAAQRRAEAQHARTRRDVTRQDRQLEQQMGYAGTPI